MLARHRRTPCSRAAPTTPACTGSARACPTTRAPSSTSPRGRWRRGPRAARVGRGGDRGRRQRRARQAPRHTDREWRQVCVGHRECLGAAQAARSARSASPSCARDKAQRSHLIVTNHSLLAIDAIEGVPMIPEYDAVVIDEAHELVVRVTQAATDELSVSEVERAARARRSATSRATEADDLADAGRCAARRDRGDPAGSDRHHARRSSATPWCWSATPPAPASRPSRKELATPARSTPVAPRPRARCRRSSSTPSGWPPTPRPTSSGWRRRGDRFPPRLCVAPLQVWGPMRDKLLTDKTVVFTSATLKLGGDFSAVATASGSSPSEWSTRLVSTAERTTTRCPGRESTSASPFDYGTAGDPLRRPAPAAARPRRPGRGPLDEIVELVDAAEGRTLGLFSAAGPPRPLPRRSASGCRTSPRSPRVTPSSPSSRSSSSTTRTPACSARSRSGRASTSPATPASS